MGSSLADAILVLHFGIAAFIVLGLLAVGSTPWHGWFWTRNFFFRLLHAAAIGYVALESLLGIHCPLTLWEDALRGNTTQIGFIARWVHRLLFFDLPTPFFTTLYLATATLTAIAWVKVPPRRPRP